jgi:phage protein D
MVTTTTTSRVTNVEVKIDGQVLADTYLSAMEEASVDHNLHLPAMLTLRFHMNNPDWLNDPNLTEGKQVEVLAKERNTPKSLFTGKIMAVEIDQDMLMPMLVVRAYDHSYALHRQRHRRSFIQVTDSDIASRLAGEAGLQPDVESTSEVYEYVFQYNQSDYEFLRERARRIGYDLYVQQQKLCFKKAHTVSGTEVALQWGQSLSRFHVRTSLAEPVAKVFVRGWDQKAKREIVGQATSPNGLPQIGAKANGQPLAQSTWNAATEYVVVDDPVISQSDATTLATAYMDELGDSFVEAEGRCEGNPDILPGRKVKIDGVGARFNGRYYVTAVTHTYSTKEGFQTTFVARSRRAGTVSELLDGTRPRALVRGPVIGIVTNLDDPEKRGRIKVWLPWLGDKGGQTPAESHWARIATPLTGKARGCHFLPEINDEVLVDFLQGDINQPYIIGGLWNGQDEPPVPPSLPGGRQAEVINGGVVKNRIIKSKKGNLLIFNDTDEAPGVFLVGSSGAYVMVDDENGKEKIALADKTKRDRIEIRSEDQSIWIEAQGPITIKATGDIKVETQGNLDAKATGNANVEATGNLTAKATGNANVEATGNLTLKGSVVSLEATGALTIKGATVTVQASGPAAIKGTPLALN